MSAYYNEHDPQAAAWLRELINAGLIAPGEVDERSIEDVVPTELAGYTQCHFFAGIGGWSYALRLAGWPDDRSVWTGSCPCQPFSAAGRRGGLADERHLWPAFWWLINQCRPSIVFGEQVASKAGRDWLAGVRADLELLGYAVGAADLCAAGVGAPHIRQRLWWVAESHGRQRIGVASSQGCKLDGSAARRLEGDGESECGGEGGGLADSTGTRRDGPFQQPEGETRHQARMLVPGPNSPNGGLADSYQGRRGRRFSPVGRQAWGDAARSGDGLEHPASDGRQEWRAESGGRSAAGGCGAGGLEYADGERRQGQRLQLQPGQARRALPETPKTSADGGLGDTECTRAGWDAGTLSGAQTQGDSQRLAHGRVGDGAVDASADGGMGDAGGTGRQERERIARVQRTAGQPSKRQAAELSGNPWADALWLPCTDGKARRIEPGIEPLVDGLPGRVGLLRGYGNAIVPQCAAAFVEAFLDVIGRS